MTSATFSLLAFAFGALRRRWRRSLALVGGIATCSATLFAALALASSLRAQAAIAKEIFPDLVVQQLAGGRPTLLKETLAVTLRQEPGALEVTPRVWGYLFLPAIQANITLLSAELPLDPRWLEPPSSTPVTLAPEECVLGEGLARALGVRPGDHFRLPAFKDASPLLRVRGIFRSPLAFLTSDAAVVPTPLARQLLLVPPGYATDLAIHVSSQEEIPTLASKALELAPGLRVIDRFSMDRANAIAFGHRSGLVVVGALPGILLFFVLAWERLVGLGSSEQQELAVLKACGWSTSDVITARVFEAVLLAALGTSVGIFLGYLWAFRLGAPGLQALLSGWQGLFPPQALAPSFEGSLVLTVVALCGAPFVALSVAPAWRAATQDPMSLLRA